MGGTVNGGDGCGFEIGSAADFGHGAAGGKNGGGAGAVVAAGGGGLVAGAANTDVKPSFAVLIAIACGGIAMPVTAETLRCSGSIGAAA